MRHGRNVNNTRLSLSNQCLYNCTRSTTTTTPSYSHSQLSDTSVTHRISHTSAALHTLVTKDTLLAISRARLVTAEVQNNVDTLKACPDLARERHLARKAVSGLFKHFTSGEMEERTVHECYPDVFHTY